MVQKPTVGEKNKNFWNMKKPGDDSWKGAVGYDPKGHAIFTDPAYSARAAIRNLRSYYFNHKLDTLRKIFGRYAPVSDTQGSIKGRPKNDPDAYAQFVADETGLTIDQKLKLFNRDRSLVNPLLMKKILMAMAEYENYSGFNSDDAATRGLVLYTSGV